jgi:DNA polymerase V
VRSIFTVFWQKTHALMYAIVDCNNFFASCERVFRPDLRTRPIVVLSNNDGCIISRSAEAKKLGIKMGAPYFDVREQLEKNGVNVFSSNYALYGDFSHRVMNALAEFVDRDEDLEVYSIDEAFLHLTPLTKLHEPEAYCQKIRTTVEQWTGIPVSIGIAPTKTLAKIANTIAKKYKGYGGVFHLNTTARMDKVLDATPVEDVWGVGRRLAEKLKQYGLYTARQLRDCNDALIRKTGGVVLLRTVHELRGTPCFFSDAVPDVRKGIASTRSFGQSVTSFEDLREAVSTYVSRAAVKLRKQQSAAGSLYVYVRTSAYGESEKYSRSLWRELPVHTDSTPELAHHAIEMLREIYREGYQYKKAGVMLSQLIPRSSVQLNAFDTADRSRHTRAMRALDQINRIHGNDMLRIAASGSKREWVMKSDMKSSEYTTRWNELFVLKV